MSKTYEDLMKMVHDSAIETIDLAMYQRIRDEGLNPSHFMDFGYALMDGIGPRLTGSPNLSKANAWTRDTLTGATTSGYDLYDMTLTRIDDHTVVADAGFESNNGWSDIEWVSQDGKTWTHLGLRDGQHQTGQ